MVSNTATQRTDIGYVLRVKTEKKLQCVPLPQQTAFFKIVRAMLQSKNFIYADTDHHKLHFISVFVYVYFLVSFQRNTS